MVCRACRTTNPDTAHFCNSCGTLFDLTDAPTEAMASVDWARPAATPVPAAVHPGTVLNDRYEITALIGEGGMGAVYKAHDRELDRTVALKVVRPEIARNPEILRRFKQELILTRGITHRNVVRVFDLGVADGTRFITMEYIEGSDLASLVAGRGGRLPAREAALLVKQVLLALEAAHGEGVVHRDLKPRNIMVDEHGKAMVMDFGIARAPHLSSGHTTAGVIGTPAYMSPEQARGEPVDARSDLFAAGLIFYEILTGVLPCKGESTVSMLLKRAQGQVTPPMELDPSIPPALNQLIMKLLAPKPEQRHASARDALDELEAWLEPRVQRAGRRATVLAASLACVALIAGVAVAWRLFRPRASPPRPAVKLLVSDFQNLTSDAVFEGALESTFSLALEGAAFIAAFDRVEAKRIAAQVNRGNATLTEAAARLVAVREGISVVVAGAIAPGSKGYVLRLRAVDASTGKVLMSRESSIRDKTRVLNALGKLAAEVRRTLGDTTPESVQLAAAETFTSASIDAAHAYALAQEFAKKARWDDAVREYKHAVEYEPGLGRAYSGMAVVYANQGLASEAENYYKLALARLDRMTPRERYRTRGAYYLFRRNHQQAVEEFTALAKEFPADSAVWTDLALAHFYRRDMPRALAEGRRALDLYPNDVIKRINVGLYAMYSGEFQAAEQEFRKVLQQNPSYAKAQLALGLVQLAQGRREEAVESYSKLASFPGRGASYSAIALADLAIAEGRFGDAAEACRPREGQSAMEVALRAWAHAQAGRYRESGAAADGAVKASRQDAVLFTGALAYVAAGENGKAAAVVSELEARAESDPRAYARIVRGEQRLKAGEPSQAVEEFRQAQQIADTWLGRFGLSRAHVLAGRYVEAHSELEVCLKRRGEAVAVFLDDLPAYRLQPAVHYYLGRAQEGLKSNAAGESYRAFLSFKLKSERDAMVDDARSRTVGLHN